MSKIELGQRSFAGNSIREHELDDYVIALLKDIYEDVTTTYWNIYQKDIDLNTDEWITDKFEFRPFDWSFDDKEKENKTLDPNISYKDVKINFYKYLGRGTTSNKNWDSGKWVNWYNDFKKELSNFEKNNENK